MQLIRRTFAILAVMSALFATPAFARERLLQPSDDWTMVARDESCLVFRRFADPAGKVIRLQIQLFNVHDPYKILMIGNGLPLGDRSRGIGRFSYRFQPDRAWHVSWGTSGRIGGEDSLIFYGDLAAAGEAERFRQRAAPFDAAERRQAYISTRVREVRQFAIAYPRRDDTVLEIGAIEEPLAWLRDCFRKLTAKWGYDPTLYENLRAEPSLANATQVGEALVKILQSHRISQNDPLHLRIDIAKDGTAGECAIQFPTLSNEIEAQICQSVREAGRFGAAIDADGQQVRAPYVVKVQTVVPL